GSPSARHTTLFRSRIATGASADPHVSAGIEVADQPTAAFRLILSAPNPSKKQTIRFSKKHSCSTATNKDATNRTHHPRHRPHSPISQTTPNHAAPDTTHRSPPKKPATQPHAATDPTDAPTPTAP